MIRREGVFSPWKGLTYPLLFASVQSAILFQAYGWTLRQLAGKPQPQPLAAEPARPPASMHAIGASQPVAASPVFAPQSPLLASSMAQPASPFPHLHAQQPLRHPPPHPSPPPPTASPSDPAPHLELHQVHLHHFHHLQDQPGRGVHGPNSVTAQVLAWVLAQLGPGRGLAAAAPGAPPCGGEAAEQQRLEPPAAPTSGSGGSISTRAGAESGTRAERGGVAVPSAAQSSCSSGGSSSSSCSVSSSTSSSCGHGGGREHGSGGGGSDDAACSVCAAEGRSTSQQQQQQPLTDTPSAAPLPTPWHGFMAGSVSGFAQVFLWSPVELLKLRAQLQTATRGSAGYRNPAALAAQVLRQDGMAGLYRGFTLTVVRDVPSYAAYFWLYHDIAGALSPGMHPEEAPPATQVVAGGMAGVLAWLPIYPLDVIKTRVQAVTAADGQGKSWRHFAGELYQEAGLRAFYRGVGPTLVRAFMMDGASFLGYTTTLRLLSGGGRGSAGRSGGGGGGGGG